MAERLTLHEELCTLLGSRNVYFNPPESVKMRFDAIRYDSGGWDLKRANNKVYSATTRYDGVVITKDPDTDLPMKLINHFEMISFGSPYIADNLNHYPFTLYY